MPFLRLIQLYSANIVYVRNGNYSRTYGTSVSVQVIGAIVTLINDARLALGKGTVGESQLNIFLGHDALIFMPPGFINPLVYNALHSVDRVVTSL